MWVEKYKVNGQLRYRFVKRYKDPLTINTIEFLSAT